MKLSLGIETSSYTTSICLVDQTGQVVLDRRKILEVPPGSRGLRQSEALFQHVQTLPALTKEIGEHLKGNELAAIAVATKPRPREDSYLPVFLPGISLAHSVANIMQVPLYELTHQEAHIWAGLGSARGPAQFPFLSIHLSGGTTELTAVDLLEDSLALNIELWGGTSDLHGGQFVDRLGVALGLPFPAGPHLEELAKQAQKSIPVPTFQRDGTVSFSGPLSALERLLPEESRETLALSCFSAISRTLIKWLRWAETKTTCRQILIVGGVAANSLIRQDLIQALPQWQFFFAEPRYSVDNAYGSAFFGAVASGLLSLAEVEGV